MNVLPGSSWATGRAFVRYGSTLCSYAGGEEGEIQALLFEPGEFGRVLGLASSCAAEAGDETIISPPPPAAVGTVRGTFWAFLRRRKTKIRTPITARPATAPIAIPEMAPVPRLPAPFMPASGRSNFLVKTCSVITVRPDTVEVLAGTSVMAGIV